MILEAFECEASPSANPKAVGGMQKTFQEHQVTGSHRTDCLTEVVCYWSPSQVLTTFYLTLLDFGDLTRTSIFNMEAATEID